MSIIRSLGKEGKRILGAIIPKRVYYVVTNFVIEYCMQLKEISAIRGFNKA